MKKLLTAAAAFGIAANLFFGALPTAHAEQFPSTNIEHGCLILALTVNPKFDDEYLRTSQSCARLKARYTKAKSTDNLMDCMIGMLMVRNRLRGQPDLDRPSLEVRQFVAKGCAMVVENISEADYDRVPLRLKD